MKLVIYDYSILSSGDEVLGVPEVDGNRLLTYSWMYGVRMFKLLNKLDAAKGVSSWDEALTWLENITSLNDVSEIQFYGHGAPGFVLIGKEYLSEASFSGPHGARLKAIGNNMKTDAMWWWRTCSTFATPKGKSFAKAFANTLNRKVAAHTHRIGLWHSGGRSLMPGQEPYWSDKEGVNPDSTLKGSGPFKNNTIICLNSTLPPTF